MSEKREKNESRMLRADHLWMRVYERKSGLIFALTNFNPSDYPEFINKLYFLVKIVKIDGYSDANMGVIQFKKGNGVPVVGLIDLMQSLERNKPEVVKHAEELE